MKFEFNPKTGIMEPKMNKQIYFARSMSGGLRVDDNINNIKFIIEHDGSIKYLSGEKKINIYDQRNAHIIADRVKRMFGHNHKYANYQEFLYRKKLIESYEEFISEQLWSKSIQRSKSGEIRKEDGITIQTPVGKVILNDKGCGIPYKLSGDDYFFIINDDGNDKYIFGYEDDGTYTYFEYNEEDTYEEDGNLLQIATSDYDMTTDDFILLRAMLDIDPNFDDMSFVEYGENTYACECNNKTYNIYDDFDVVKEVAFERVKDYLLHEDDINLNIERYRDYFGDDFIDASTIEDFMREDYENYVNEIENENGYITNNRLFDELIEHEIIEDSDDYFETDEDGELDYDSPTFSVQDAKDDLVDILCDNYDDPVQWYIDNFGADNLSEYIDIDKLTELIIDSDGYANSLGCDNEYEFHKDGYDIYIYD